MYDAGTPWFVNASYQNILISHEFYFNFLINILKTIKQEAKENKIIKEASLQITMTGNRSFMNFTCAPNRYYHNVIVTYIYDYFDKRCS